MIQIEQSAMQTRVALGLALAAAALSAAGWLRPVSVRLGFSTARAQSHAVLERRFLALPSAERIRDAHRVLADKPHMAGSPRDRELAEWTRDRFREAGLEDVSITTHDVLLPWPEEISVEMTAPKSWRASMREDRILDDPDTWLEPRELGLPFHAYSASGDLTAPVIYAGSGAPGDYDWLAARGIDVRGKIVLVRYSMPYSYRGYKALVAQNRGAAGILIYSDPADDGGGRGQVYPVGPWGPASHIQRGGVVYDFLVPGDPLTPGWASLPGAHRIPSSEAVSLPRIMSAPLSYMDARVILESLGGPEVPEAWRGALPGTHRVGPGAALVRMRVRSDDRVRPIWTVTGSIRGADRPDDVIVVGNHRDAWVYGGVDPSSGSAALIELAHNFGELKRRGWRPSRTILFASWDAEEFSLTSSTEWGEQHESWLRKHAVAYLNVDSAASGRNLAVAAVPSLNAVISEVALTVRDPASGLTLAARARDRLSRELGAIPSGSGEDFIDNRLGGGSDYTVFLNFLGVPSADLSFEGPYGVYHSMYDTHHWVATIGDPGFHYHEALVRFWGILTLNLADADIVPLDYEPYALRIEDFAREVGRRWVNAGAGSTDPLADVRTAAAEMRAAAVRLNQRRSVALARGDTAQITRLNEQLLSVERMLLDPDGIPGRPWYRHLVYAPKFTYAPEVLPGVAAALDASDVALARAQAQRLAAALRRAAAALDY
jgi:N-acetylated-alpha-linked acidic dipeptidase